MKEDLTPTKQQSFLMQLIAKGMKRGIDLATGKDVTSIRKSVERQKELHPELKDDPAAITDRIIRKKQWYAGAVSFCWGFGGILTLIPHLAHIWRIHGRLVLTIAYIYGYDLDDPELREDIALCFALSSSNESVKRVLKEASLVGAKKALLTQTMKTVIKKLPNKLITIAGTKSLLNVTKIVPIVGALVFGIIDFFSTKGIGKAAKAYYS